MGPLESATALPRWPLLFAQNTESDLDFDEDLDDLEETPSRGYSPRGPRKKPGRSPLVWVLLLVLVGGGAYLVMDPDFGMELLAPIIGEPSPPPMVVQPPPKSTAAVPKVPAGSLPSAPGKTDTPQPTPAVAAIPSPQFGEGQPVSVILDPTAPGGSLSLSADPSGSRPGPTVRPGAALTVMDGTLQNNTWVYSVRTQDGATGWIAEKRLVAKP